MIAKLLHNLPSYCWEACMGGRGVGRPYQAPAHELSHEALHNILVWKSSPWQCRHLCRISPKVRIWIESILH